MVTAEPKINKPSIVQPQKAGTNFFRKAGEGSFFQSNKNNTINNHPVQAKLTVSEPNDPHEKEADQVADKVMRMQDPAPAPTSLKEEKISRKEEEEIQPKKDPVLNLKIFRKEDHEETAERKTDLFLHRQTANSGRAPPQNSISFQDNLSASKGAGSELPAHTRGFMETRFNVDFGKVRVHTGSNAQVMSSQVHAQAFTHGNDIYFNEDKFSPDSSGGRHLLAHELTHTIQQGASPKVNRKPTATNPTPVQNIDLSGKSGGSTLDDDAKKYFKKTFKADVGDVLLHSDEEAAQICRSRRVPAFTQGRHICLDPAKYSPTSEEGGVLLARQVSESLKQRSIIAPGAGIKFGSAEKNKAAGPAKPKKAGGKDPSKKDKKKADAKDAHGAKKKGAPEKHKGKRGADKGYGPPLKSPKPNPKKSPSTPDEDAAFQRVVGKTKTTAKSQKQHDPAESKATDAQKASPAAPKEAESKAKERKTDGMDEAGKKDKPFDAKSFKAELLKKIEEATPKTLEDVDDFKGNDKVGEVKSAMTGKVSEEKKETTGPVSNANAQPLQVNDADNKHPLPLPPTPKGRGPAPVGAPDAAPKAKMDNEISLQQKSNSLDEEMKANNVTEEQLTKSNEPSFAAALDQKKGAQKDAVDRPKQFRKDEGLMLTQAKAGAQNESVHALAGMDVARGKNLATVVQHQHATQQKDHLTRASVAATIEGKYAVAEALVTKTLDEADKESARIFDEGAELSRTEFENEIDRKMSAYKRERYSGFWGGLSWLEDKLFGMPDDVIVFYTQGRQTYLDKMDQVITRVANYVTSKLNEAKQAIKNAKKDIDDYVHKLPKDLADVGKQAASDIQDKFDTLEQNVNDKKDQLIEGLAKKYVDNVKKIDDRIDEMKEANAGLIDKAIGFLKKVWQVIKDLKNLFTSILSKLASIVGTILSSPGGFFDNLGKAFNKGLNNFKDKFLDYLEQGLMDWLMTNLGISGIELPKTFSPMAIFSLVLQVLGLTKQHIKERAVTIVGEKTVRVMETAGGLLYRVFNEGLGVLWEMIQEKLTDLKDVVWEAIKSFIKTKIIEAALVFLLSMLNPIGAFIKVCMAIYDFLMMLVRFKDRIMELLDSILKAVTDVASGAIDGAANAIEKAFAKSIPVIIGFLAALLHLNDIAAKVRDIITRIRARVDKALDFVITKGVGIVKGITGGARSAVGAGGTPKERLDNGLKHAQSAVNKYAGKRVGGVILKPILGIIKIKYGFESLDVIAKGKNWFVKGKINPEGEVPTDAMVQEEEQEEKEDDQSMTVRSRAAEALQKEIGEGKSELEIKTIAHLVEERLKPQGIKKLIVGEKNSDDTIPVSAEASPLYGLGRFRRRTVETGNIPKGRSVKTAVQIDLSSSWVERERNIPKVAGHMERGGAFISELNVALNTLDIYTWNTTPSLNEHNETHAERQFVSWLINDRKILLPFITRITMRNFSKSPCTGCSGHLRDLITTIRSIQEKELGAVVLQRADIFWTSPYTSSGGRTTWPSLIELADAGWICHAPEKGFPPVEDLQNVSAIRGRNNIYTEFIRTVEDQYRNPRDRKLGDTPRVLRTR